MAYETSPSPPLLTASHSIKPGLEFTTVTPQSRYAGSSLHRNDTEESQSLTAKGLVEPGNAEGSDGANQMLLNEISHLRGKLHQSEAALAERNSAEHANRQALQNLSQQQADNEQRVRNLERQLLETVASRDLLKESFHLKEAQETERESILKGKTARITELEAQAKSLAAQSDAEKRELTMQIEELRRAGQVRLHIMHYGPPHVADSLTGNHCAL